MSFDRVRSLVPSMLLLLMASATACGHPIYDRFAADGHHVAKDASGGLRASARILVLPPARDNVAEPDARDIEPDLQQWWTARPATSLADGLRWTLAKDLVRAADERLRSRCACSVASVPETLWPALEARRRRVVQAPLYADLFPIWMSAELEAVGLQGIDYVVSTVEVSAGVGQLANKVRYLNLQLAYVLWDARAGKMVAWGRIHADESGRKLSHAAWERLVEKVAGAVFDRVLQLP